MGCEATGHAPPCPPLAPLPLSHLPLALLSYTFSLTPAPVASDYWKGWVDVKGDYIDKVSCARGPVPFGRLRRALHGCRLPSGRPHCTRHPHMRTCPLHYANMTSTLTTWLALAGLRL